MSSVELKASLKSKELNLAEKVQLLAAVEKKYVSTLKLTLQRSSHFPSFNCTFVPYLNAAICHLNVVICCRLETI